ncbi:MAG: DUF2279 domain-containing protein [Ignavibacteriales bacterium]|nr:MAG: DUF2279 domain-containing protein [Ignavibacteriales bacterium]
MKIQIRIALVLLVVSTVFIHSQSDSEFVVRPVDKISDNSELKMSIRGTYHQSHYDSLLLMNFAVSNKIDPFDSEINYTALAGVGAITLGTGIAVHIYQRNAWWKDQRSSFHFTNDWDYALYIDKVGHFYGANLLAHLFSAGLEAGNIQSEQAAIYGSVAALAFQLYVEIEDGFGPNWGFSPGDAIADVLGSGYALGQYYFPYLKNFQFKFSYWPSQKMKDGTHKGNGIDDYEGQIYWLSLRMKNLLPKSVSEYWPAWLCLAGGMGVRNLDGIGGGQKEFYIAFDLDAEEIPLYGSGWQFVKNTLNYIHFPMPGIRVTPDAAFFVFTF